MSSISGTVKRISPDIKMIVKKCPASAVFVEICSENCETVYLALIEGGVTKKSQLALNESYRFSGLKKSLWRAVESKADGKNRGAKKTPEIYWYIGDGDCKIASSKRKEISSSNTAINDADITKPSNEIDTKVGRFKSMSIEMGQPISPYLQSIFAGREISIEGVVRKLNHLGWLEMSLSSPVFCIEGDSILAGKKSEVDVFLVHRRRSEIIDSLQNGTEIKVSFVFPIFLWGMLSGFAATVRSHIEIVKRAQCSSSSSSGGDCSSINRHCNNFSCSRKDDIEGSSEGSHNDHKPNYHKNNSANVRFQVPTDIRTRCHLYASWRANIQRKYKKCLASSSPSESSSSSSSKNSSSQYSNSKGSNSKRSNDRYKSSTIPTGLVIDEAVRFLERSPAESYTGGAERIGNNPRNNSNIFIKSEYNHNEVDGHDSNNSSQPISTAAYSCAIDNGRDGRTGNITYGDHEYISISELTLLPPNRSVQEEFMDPLYAELFSVRAGCDADWLSSLFPKVFSCSDLRVLKDRVVTSRDGVNHRNSNGGQSHEGSQWGVHIVKLGNINSLPSSPSPSPSPPPPASASASSLHSHQIAQETQPPATATAIIGSVVGFKVNEDETFAVLKLRDFNGSTVKVLIRGWIGESLTPRVYESLRQSKFDPEGSNDLLILGNSYDTISDEVYINNSKSNDNSSSVCDSQSSSNRSSLSDMKLAPPPPIQTFNLVAVIRNPLLLIECNPLSSNKDDASKLFVMTTAAEIRITRPVSSCLPQSAPTTNPPRSHPAFSLSSFFSSTSSTSTSGPMEMALLLGEKEGGSGLDPNPNSGTEGGVLPSGARAVHNRMNLTKTNNQSSSLNIDGAQGSVSVRQLLLPPNGDHPKEDKKSKCSGYYDGQVLPSLTGVVVYKSLIAEQPYGQEVVSGPLPLRSEGGGNGSSLQGQNPYKIFCQRQEEDFQRNERFTVRPKVKHRECNLILRDERYSDIISVYIPAHLAAAAVVGLKVVLTNATIKITKTRKMCLKYSQVNNTQIGVLGMTSGVQLDSLGIRSTTMPRVSQPDLHPGLVYSDFFSKFYNYIAPSPRVTISQLVTSRERGGNAALWSILGQMIHIKKITVSLKCTLCYSDVREDFTGFSCWNCGCRDSVKPLWTATVVFDDGTGECLVHVEGPPVKALLKSRTFTSADSKNLLELQTDVETCCKQYGKVCYDAYYSRWNKIDTLNSAYDDGDVDSDDSGGGGHDSIPPNSSITNNPSWMGSSINSNVHNHTQNFYKNPSPAHRGEKALEKYVNSLTSTCDSSTTLLLTVKVIKSNKRIQIINNNIRSGKGNDSLSSSRSDGNHNLEIKSSNDEIKKNDDNQSDFDGNENEIRSNDDPFQVSVGDGDIEVIDKNAALKVLLDSVGKSTNTNTDDISARYIKVQQNNSEKPHSTSFKSVPTLASKRLSVEAVSVKAMNANDIRLETWRQLQLLQKEIFNDL